MTRVAILFAIAIPFSQAQESAALPVSEQVDKIFGKWDSTISPGCALSVIRDGRIIYKRGYGMADLDHDIPINSETVFHVASISKQFTAASIALLAQQGKLSLDDDVHKYIPELPDFGVAITIKQLIYHTSGLRDQWELLDLAGWRYSLDLITDDDVLSVIERQKELNFRPGEEHVYCNTGYTLLAQIVKRVSGQSLREFTTKNIFVPLGMWNTHFRDDHADVVKHIAYGYVEGEHGNSLRLSVTNFDTVGATSLLTTVEDLALWDENFYHPRVGGPQLVQQQLERGKLNSGKELSYAFGLQHGTYRGLATVDHGGADAGYRADFIRFPEQHFSVACLCNKGEINPGELTRKVADVYLADNFKEQSPAQFEASKKPYPLSDEWLKHFTGLYWNNEQKRAGRIVFKEGKLFVAASDDDQMELQAIAENQFKMARAPMTVTFDNPASGPPKRLTILGRGAEKADVFERAIEFKPTPTQLTAYSGVYTSPELEPVYRIEVDHESLVLKRLKYKPEKLDPRVEDHFSGLHGDIQFQKDSSGRVSGFVLTAGRIRNFHFVKRP